MLVPSQGKLQMERLADQPVKVLCLLVLLWGVLCRDAWSRGYFVGEEIFWKVMQDALTA